MIINLPHDFEYRDYQKPQFIASTKGINRFIKVWHRRAGKDITDLNFTVMKSMERKGVYWHMLPEFEQARNAIWQGMTKDGKRYLDHFPPEIIKRVDNQSMLLELVNGSIWMLQGSNRIDKRVGSGPVGVVLSEYSLSMPDAWGKIEPMLLENNGWASFNFTPRGKNHAHKLLELAQKNPKWFTQVLTIDDTRDLDGNPIMTEEMINELRRMGTDEETIQQEYYCSFEGSMQGAYYAEQLRWLEKNNKIVDFPLLPEYPVQTYWDIGRRDYTTIWFMQEVAGEFRIVDYYYVGGGDVDIFARELKNKGYRYGTHHLPHDAGHLRVGMAGKTVHQQLQAALPNETFKTLPVTGNINNDIVATRLFLRRCAFHKTNTDDGVQALQAYVKKWNDKQNRYDDTPVHNWASHACLAGDSIIKTTRGDVFIKDIKGGDKVILGNFTGNVSAAGITGYKETIILCFDDGTELECTPNHKILTNNGVVYADALRYNDLILIGGLRWNFILGRMGARSYINMIARYSRVKGSIKGRMVTLPAVIRQLFICTGLFGKIVAEKSRKVITFTIKTATRQTTRLVTLSLSPLAITQSTMPEVTNGLGVKPTNSSFERQELKVKSGMLLRQDATGINKMAKKLGLIDCLKSNSARIAEMILNAITTTGRSSAKQNAKTLISIKPGSLQPVYDMTVDNHHCYIANGTLVSNSDAFRELAIHNLKKADTGHKTVTNKTASLSTSSRFSKSLHRR